MPTSRIRNSCFVIALWIVVGLISAGAQAAESVSPGSPEVFGLTDSRCPTFSWTADAGGEEVEFVIYRVGAMGIETKPHLEATLPAKATTWTPSVGQCLERGQQYAWSVRTLSDTRAAEWSAPSFFKVSLETSRADFEQALNVVREYLANHPEGVEARPASAEDSAPAAEGPSRGTSAPSDTSFVVVDAGMSLVDPSDNKYLYVQLDTVGTSGGSPTAPPASDCDEVNERGRMMYDPSGAASGGYLWICDDTGWRSEFI